MAYRCLNLKPWEFYSLTFVDLEEMLEGWMWRHKREQEKLASFVSVPLINFSERGPKRSITVKKFLGRPVGDDNDDAEDEITKESIVKRHNIPDQYLNPDLRREKD